MQIWYRVLAILFAVTAIFDTDKILGYLHLIVAVLLIILAEIKESKER